MRRVGWAIFGTGTVCASLLACGGDDSLWPVGDDGGSSHAFDGSLPFDGATQDGGLDATPVDATLSDASDAGADGAGGPCPASTLTVNVSISGSNAGKLDEFAGSCGPVGTADQAFVFVAPRTGNYVFQADDAAVFVLDGTCRGTELACTVSTATIPAGTLVSLAKDQTVTVVVDDTNGPFSLDTLDVTCPRATAPTSLPATITVPLDYGDDFRASCATTDGGGVDTEVTFVAPSTGTYEFDTQTWPDAGSEPHPQVSLSMLDGGCTGSEIACSDPSTGSVILQDLGAGQQVTMVIDDVDPALPRGTGTLNIEKIAPPTCPRGVITGPLPVTVESQTFNATDNFPDCKYLGYFGFADVDWVFTAPHDGTFTFDATGSTVTNMIGFYQGSCTGAMLACSGDGFHAKTQQALTMTAGETVTVAVEAGGGGHILLTVDELGGVCPNETIAGPLPMTTSGTTVGADNTAVACGNVASPDVTYAFTPSQGGFYFFSADATGPAPNVSIHDATCGGEELACGRPPNDSDPAVAEAKLTAGQTVEVVVDSPTSPGPFDLTASRYACNDAGNVVPFDVEIPYGAYALVPGCGSFYYSAGDPGDSLFTFAAPTDGRYEFESASLGLVVLDGDCGGAASACTPTFYTSHYNYTHPFTVVGLTSGQIVTLVATNPYRDSLHGEKLTDTCPDGTITGALPATPTLDYADNDVVPSCAYTGRTADATLSFTAPTAGTYRFDGLDAYQSYGAVAVLDGSCSGAELGCAADSNFYHDTTRVETTLAAGQTVIVVVEGMDLLTVSKLP